MLQYKGLWPQINSYFIYVCGLMDKALDFGSGVKIKVLEKKEGGVKWEN